MNDEKRTYRYRWFSALLLGLILPLLAVGVALATGNISATDKWAWGTNVGWVNFAPDNGGVTVYSDHLEGYAWAENIGWLRLGTCSGSPCTHTNTTAANYGVNNDGHGQLSGYAWGTNVGWINFAPSNGGVTINPASGSFDGYAWGENIGWIHFKNSNPAYTVVNTPPHLAVNLGSLHGVKGETISIPVDLTSNGANVHSFDVTATYNASCMQLDNVILQQSASGRSLDHQSLGVGSEQIILTDVGSAAPLVNGTLFHLNFTVLCGRPNTTIGLTVVSVGSSGGQSISATAAGDTLKLNSRPVAANDAAQTNEDSSVVVFVEGNDSDGDAGDNIDVISLTQPSAGSATLVNGNDNGNQVDDTIIYNPGAAFHSLAVGESAQVSFTYTLRDVPAAAGAVTDDDTATVNVTIVGVNDKPVAANDSANTDEDSVVTVYVLANDTDPDTSDSGHVVSAVNTTGTKGAVVNNGGTVTYDPRAYFQYLAVGETATDSFAYTVSDGKGGTAQASVTVTVVGVNDAPQANHDVAAQPNYLITGPTTPLTINPLVNDSDPDTLDRPDLTLSALGSARAAIAGQTIVWTPNGLHGAETFAYTLNDSHGRSSTANITVVSGVRGDCNKDGKFDAGDLTACVLELLDGDASSTDWLTTGGGSFPGSPLGCDANRDNKVGAGDLSCKVKMLMQGVNVSCAAVTRSTAQATLALDAANADGSRVLRFNGNGNGVAAAVVSLGVDASASFDTLAWSLPAGFESAFFYADGKLTLVVYSLGLAVLPDGDIVTLRFSGAADAVGIQADATSLGSVDGSSVEFSVDGPSGTQFSHRLFLPVTNR